MTELQTGQKQYPSDLQSRRHKNAEMYLTCKYIKIWF